MSQFDFLNILFNDSEETCFASNPYEIDIDFMPLRQDIFFSINPMHATRADINVVSFRNILIEIDTLPLAQQIDYVTSKLPVTSIVFSGSKSYHFIISLEEPCKDRADYDQLVARIYELLPEADRSARNPSRFSRLPGAIRPETGKEQSLTYLGSRISRAKIESALPPPKPPKQHTQTEPGFYHPLVVHALFTPDEVMQQLKIDSRNGFFFWLGQRLKETGCDSTRKEEIISTIYLNLKHKVDFSLREAKNAARVK